MGIAIAQATPLATARQMKYGERAYHGSIRSLLNKSVLDPELHVTRTVERGCAPGLIKSHWNKQVELEVWDNTIVHFQMRGGARDPILIVCVLGRHVEFPVLVFYGLRVIGSERRAGKYR